MNQLTAMRVFTEVWRLQSFTLAATHLGMSAAAVTRHVGMLEAHLNVRLINRTTRRLSLSDAGSDYLDACRTILRHIDEVESAIADSTLSARGTLRIGTSRVFASAYLCDLLSAYSRTQTAVNFEVQSFDGEFDPAERGLDIGFVDIPPTRSSLICRELFSFSDVLVASPAYLSGHGKPETPGELENHKLLKMSGHLQHAWEFRDRAGCYRVEHGRGALKTSSPEMARVAALRNMGIALLPNPLVRGDIMQGSLIHLLEAFDVDRSPQCFSLVYQERSKLTAKVRTFVDFTTAYFRDEADFPPLKAVA
ncbi:LysR family transcriptional regulator [Trinickia mobilis]|uniref:LysR family transcriptional regulator n=1 Tax=Trinickia mobilis TaxID=2816356 RepID=UPI001A8C7E5D|nr:LysR family transcriptional regulator [Trinickia mobilis]